MRVPPHDLEAEAALLGSMMLNRDAIHDAIEARIGPDDFYKPAHGLIFEAITRLAGKGDAVDPVTVTGELERSGDLERTGGKPALLRIQAEAPASTSARTYAPTVAGLATLRRLIRVGGEIAEIGYDRAQEPRAALDEAEKLLLALGDHRDAERTVTLATSIDAVMERIDKAYTDPPGLRTGFRELDDLLLGLRPAGLYLIAARPSMGKSAFALAIAEHCAGLSKPALVFSLEMEHEDLTSRLLSAEARVDLRKLLTGRLNDAEWSKVNTAVSRITDYPLFMNDDPSLTLMEIRAKARRLKARHGLGLIVVDYLQLMTAEGETRQQAVADLSRGLKLLARELEVPVLALSQLNRQLEYRSDKRPLLADLRDSGSLEQDADVVMFLYRDEIYNPESDQRGVTEVIVSKHRNGPLGAVRLAFMGNMTKFAEMARDEIGGS